MGTSYYANVYYAAKVTMQDFWADTKEKVYLCAKSHPTEAGHKFCSECGSPVKEYSKQVPTPGFARFCAARQADPFTTYQELLDSGWKWEPTDGEDLPAFTIVHTCINSTWHSHLSPTTMGLGVTLASISAEYSQTPIHEIDPAVLIKYNTVLQALLNELQVTSELMLYVQAYAS